MTWNWWLFLRYLRYLQLWWRRFSHLKLTWKVKQGEILRHMKRHLEKFWYVKKFPNFHLKYLQVPISPLKTLHTKRITLINSFEFELESPLFWNSILQESFDSKPFHSSSASNWSEAKHDTDLASSDLHWRYFAENLISSILLVYCSILLIIVLAEVLPI